MPDTRLSAKTGQSTAIVSQRRTITRRAVARKVREGAPDAVDFLNETIKDDKVNRRDRISAAKIIVKESLAPHESNADKDLADMSEGELRAFLDTAEGELAKRARLVNPPDAEEFPSQPLDMFS